MSTTTRALPSPLTAGRSGVTALRAGGQQQGLKALPRKAPAAIVPVTARDAAPSYCAWPSALLPR